MVIPKTFLAQPAQARSGDATPSAFQQAWMISWAMNTVHMVVAAPSVAFTMLPSGATISIARNVPSLRGMSGSKNEAKAV